jgi:hypothetical protein
MMTSTTAQPVHPYATTGEDRSGLLRLALKLDAVATGALGLLALAAGPLLADLLGIPNGLLLPLGLFLIVYAAAVWFVGTRPIVKRPAVWTAVALNLVWAVDSVIAVAAGWLPLTMLGTAFVLAQAVAVLVFAELQLLGLRRARPAA